MSTVPRYKQIREFIAENISSNRWPVGTKIPTEIELTKQFSVSRMTVNKAIRDLVIAGLLERTPRIGTFVCTKKVSSSLQDIRNIADEIEQRGKHYSNKILSQISLQADDEIAMRLGVKIEATVYFTEIIHLEDDVPLQLERRWVNPDFASDYIKQDFSKATPNEYLTKHCPLSSIEHTVEAITSSEYIQQQLHLSPHAPCLLLNRRTWSNENLISVALLYHPADKYKLTLRTNV
ncbi:histidine utilization repressor [Psychromonas sp. Urea-02u-13]|uniref:histidine utilization repressor n=1 Tax=Psychromonas sp. Urea-02u-13 TaxID=2058326 RepID=UPI000C34973D|nr:histidine utilization repressor [Psychromonas sp. Urea-02u-13]PKG38956.1 histidine utilization repressor [Psychromonas sp. Urea-02u-13]